MLLCWPSPLPWTFQQHRTGLAAGILHFVHFVSTKLQSSFGCAEVPALPTYLLVPVLQILENVIKFRWAALPAEQREGIKNYISNLIIKCSTDEQVYRSQSTFINKLNLILVQILKQVCSRAGLWAQRCSRRGGEGI